MLSKEKDFKEFIINKCHCLSQKNPQHILYAPLGTITSSAPINLIATNFLKFDWYSGGYEHLLIMVDLFKRHAQGHVHDRNLPEFSRPAHDVPGTSLEGPLKVLMSRTSRGPSGDFQGTNTKIDDLMKKLFFRCNSPYFTHLFLFVYWKNKYSKGLNEDVRGTSVVHIF